MRKLADLPLSDKDRQAIEAAVGLLRKQFPIDQAILFGSKATGTDTAESDIDLLLTTRRSLTWQERNSIIDALFDIELEHDVVISALVVAKLDWDDGPYSVLPIHAEVERTGVAA
jgi:predicted nucleotidyltransferase